MSGISSFRWKLLEIARKPWSKISIQHCQMVAGNKQDRLEENISCRGTNNVPITTSRNPNH